MDGSAAGVVLNRFFATGERLGVETIANSMRTDVQSEAKVAHLSNGRYVVVWKSVNQDGSGTGIYGQEFNRWSEKIGQEFRINSFTAGDQDWPSIASDGHDDLVVVWESNGQDGSSQGIYSQRFKLRSQLGIEHAINAASLSFDRLELTDLNELTARILDGGPRGVPHLRSLSISKSTITDWSVLTTLQTLQHLNLNSTQLPQISLLPSSADLISLDLSGTNVTGMISSTTYPNLESLRLGRLNLSSSAVESAVANRSKIKTLNLQNNSLGSTSFLLNLPSLTSVDLRGNSLDAASHELVIPELIARAFWFNTTRRSFCQRCRLSKR